MKLVLIMLAFLLIPLILNGYYMFIIIRRCVSLFNVDVNKRKNKVIMIVVSIIIILSCANIYSLGTVIVLYFIIVSICMDIINIILKHIYKADIVCWRKIFCSSVVPITLTIVIIILGYFNIGNIIRTEYNINTDKVIRTEGYKIALIADMHYGNVIDSEKLIKSCEDIQKDNPDIVILCGDIVDESTNNDEMVEAFEILGSIKSTYGSFYVYGNHDEANYSVSPSFTSKQLTKTIKDNGISILADENYVINDEFTIIGRLDQNSQTANERKTAHELLENVDLQDFILLLDHQPNEIKECSNMGFDLQLSGHTHGGQIWPIGLICEVFNIGDVVCGYEKVGNSQAIVSSGMSGWGYPIRTEAKSEYVIINVLSTNKK